jgi:hypothetical protein
MAKSDIKISVRPVSDHYALPGERIIEYSSPSGNGGLIAFREDADGYLIVEAYRHGPKVKIRAGEGS